MTTETFTVRGLDGVVRAYDGTGTRVHIPIPDGRADVELRPEPSQAEECMRRNAIDKERRHKT